MEAPDKIYICPSDLAGIDYEEEWFEYPFGDSVEYIHADAFIEKAWDWIDDNVLSINQQDMTRLYFEQFKKYMKGE